MSQTVVVTDRLSAPIAEYSHAVRSGPFVLVGAKGATRPQGKVPLGDDFREAIEHQTVLTLANVEHALSQLDAHAGEVAQATVFMTDWRFQAGVDEGIERYPGAGSALSYLYSPAFALPELLFEVDVIAVSGVTPERLTAGGRTLATSSDGWVFSSTLSSRERGGNAAAELEDVAAQMDALLAEHAMSRANLMRLRWALTDRRDLAALHAWSEGWRGPRPATTVSVGSPAHVGRRLTMDFIASATSPERVEAAELGWEAEAAGATAATCAHDVAFTAAVGASASADVGLSEIVERLDSAIAPFGLSRADVAKVEGQIDDWRLYSDFRAAYTELMPAPYPTRSLTQGGARQSGAAVQLNWIAMSGGRDQARLLVPGSSGETQDQEE